MLVAGVRSEFELGYQRTRQTYASPRQTRPWSAPPMQTPAGRRRPPACQENQAQFFTT